MNAASMAICSMFIMRIKKEKADAIPADEVFAENTFLGAFW